MPNDLDVQHAERISVVETKLDAMQKTLEEMSTQLKTINNMVQQGKGASRLIMWGSVFFGASTATAIYVKWSMFMTWLGK